MRALKLIKIGRSTGLVLPKDVLATMNVGAGDTVYLTRAPGGFHLTEVGFGREIAAARKVMKRRRAALRKLAK